MNNFNKDDLGGTILLAAMFVATATALFISDDVEAKLINVTAVTTPATGVTTPALSETLVLTATRLK